MLMTYGYSGTGKTFTLFGNRVLNKEGILQATLNNIRGLGKLKLRVYELYGKGVQYPHYWKEHIYQKIIYHKLGKTENGDLTISESNETDNIMGYVKNYDTYFDINGNQQIIDIFKNFSNFVDKMDDIRKKAGRIRITPNNPDSSRSIIMYDLLLYVTGTNSTDPTDPTNSSDRYVPFIIIDLPGREEIVQTYVDRFLEKDHIKTHYNTPFDKSLLASMVINPLGISILAPTVVFETFNSIDKKDRDNIINSKLYDIIQNDTVSFKDEGLSYSDHKINKLVALYDFNSNEWNRNKQFNIEHNYNYNDNYAGQENIIKLDLGIENRRQINSNINNVQYQGVLAFFLINRLVLLRRFDVLEKISENLAKKYYNTNYLHLDTIDERRQFLNKYLDSDRVEKILKNKDDTEYFITNLMNYNSFAAPYEGIYINENIVGLIKFLSKNVLSKSDDEIQKENLAVLQDVNLDFIKQKENVREFNYDLYRQNQISSDDENYENIYRNKLVLNSMYVKARDEYSSQKIFIYEKPIIGDILNHYITSDKIINNAQVEVKINPVIKFKVFYLFSNSEMDKKCDHQIKLLDNTLNLISAIEN
jgi:hypothetical protein